MRKLSKKSIDLLVQSVLVDTDHITRQDRPADQEVGTVITDQEAEMAIIDQEIHMITTRGMKNTLGIQRQVKDIKIY